MSYESLKKRKVHLSSGNEQCARLSQKRLRGSSTFHEGINTLLTGEVRKRLRTLSFSCLFAFTGPRQKHAVKQLAAGGDEEEGKVR